MGWVIRNHHLGWYWNEQHQRWTLTASIFDEEWRAQQVADILNLSGDQFQLCEVIPLEMKQVREVMDS